MFLGKKELSFFYIASFFVLASGFFLPITIKPFFIVAHYLSFYLGKINSTMLLILFFYLFITPAGFLLKLVKKDILHLKIKREDKSYWTKRTKVAFEKEDFKNQF